MRERENLVNADPPPPRARPRRQIRRRPATATQTRHRRFLLRHNRDRIRTTTPGESSTAESPPLRLPPHLAPPPLLSARPRGSAQRGGRGAVCGGWRSGAPEAPLRR
jgi:hypothetical protein